MHVIRVYACLFVFLYAYMFVISAAAWGSSTRARQLGPFFGLSAEMAGNQQRTAALPYAFGTSAKTAGAPPAALLPTAPPTAGVWAGGGTACLTQQAACGPAEPNGAMAARAGVLEAWRHGAVQAVQD